MSNMDWDENVQFHLHARVVRHYETRPKEAHHPRQPRRPVLLRWEVAQSHLAQVQCAAGPLVWVPGVRPVQDPLRQRRGCVHVGRLNSLGNCCGH